ncbi:MAG: hypothetical protein M0Z59_09200 [Nitrospiraceae bacterium]|nr:hypothetical protein [Nitrospiraceae bacterium]
MPDGKDVNALRALNLVCGVLESQRSDPLCAVCAGFFKTASFAREKFSSISKRPEAISGEMKTMTGRIESILSSLSADEGQGIKQKKAGACRMPEGVCLTKSAIALFEKATS